MADLSFLQNPLVAILGVFLIVRFVRDLFLLSNEKPVGTPATPPPWGPIWKARRLTWLALALTAISGPWWAPWLAPFLQRIGVPDAWAWPGVLAIFVLHLGRFQCPRCGKNFTSVRRSYLVGYHNAFTRHCLNCGLEAGTPGP